MSAPTASSTADCQPSFHHSNGTPMTTAIAIMRSALQMERLKSASVYVSKLFIGCF
jgi:hypothetical protein